MLDYKHCRMKLVDDMHYKLMEKLILIEIVLNDDVLTNEDFELVQKLLFLVDNHFHQQYNLLYVIYQLDQHKRMNRLYFLKHLEQHHVIEVVQSVHKQLVLIHLVNDIVFLLQLILDQQLYVQQLVVQQHVQLF